jgi:hypothetical protein
MLSILRKRLTFANVALTVMLVFAITGGAYAASKYLITSAKQIKPSVLKQLQGKAGANGLAGPQGPAGSAGAKGETGPAGKEGTAGTSGTNGTDGTNGTSVTSTAFVGSKGSCKEGGTELTAAENKKTDICNGKEGSPWTDGGTLPVGATETGTWGGSITSHETDFVISFPIRLPGVVEDSKVHVIKASEGEGEVEESPVVKAGECKGTIASPGAASGNLCIFVNGAHGAEINAVADLDGKPSALGAGITGALLETEVAKVEAGQLAIGTWAVTG